MAAGTLPLDPAGELSQCRERVLPPPASAWEAFRWKPRLQLFFERCGLYGVLSGFTRNQTPPTLVLVSYHQRPWLQLPGPGFTLLWVVQPVMTGLRAIQFSRCRRS